MDSSPLEASKNFSRVQKYMFKVSRRCSWIRAFQRTNSHVHRTHTSAWKLGKTCFFKDFQKFISKFRNLIWDLLIFWMDSSTSEASKKFSRAQNYMFKVSRRCSWIRAFERTNSHGHTTHRSKKICRFSIFVEKNTLRYFFESHFSNCFLRTFRDQVMLQILCQNYDNNKSKCRCKFAFASAVALQKTTNTNANLHLNLLLLFEKR